MRHTGIIYAKVKTLVKYIAKRAK